MALEFSYNVADAKTVNLHLFGAVGFDEAYWEEGTNNTAFEFTKLINKFSKTHKRINLHINSPGGRISDGLAIYNALIKSNAEVHTYNAGLVGSMAAILILAGITHFPKTSVFHLHRASSGGGGNINDLQEVIKALETFETVLQQAISDKTGLAISEIKKKWFDGKDHYMTATEANEFGFVDVFDENTKVYPPATIANLKNMNREEIYNLYSKKGKKKNVTFKDMIANGIELFFNKEDNPKKKIKKPKEKIKMANTAVFKSAIALCLALEISAFQLNDEGDAYLSPDELMILNQALSSAERKATNLESKLEAERTVKADMEAKIKVLEAKIKNTPNDKGVNPKNNDGDGGDGGKGANIEITNKMSDEIEKHMKDFF